MKNSFVIVSGKGGVGKSTSAAALGKILSERGNKTLLIDCDAGLSSLDVLLNISDKKLFNWYDVYKKRCEPDEALCTVTESLWLIPAPDAPVTEPAEDAIRALAKLYENRFDYIIIDAPAGLGAGFERAVKAAKNALVVVTADSVCVKDASAVQSALLKYQMNSVRMLVNRYDIKAAKKGYLLTLDQLIDRSYVQLLGIVPEDKSLTYQSVKRTKKQTGKSTKAFERVADRLQGKNVPLSLSKLS